MYPGFQPLLGDLLYTLRAGLDHQADVAMHGRPPEMHGDASYGGFHPMVSSHGGSMGQKVRVLMEGRGQQVASPLPCQCLGSDSEAAMFVESESRKPAGILLFISRLAPELGLGWGLPVSHPLADTEQERILGLGFQDLFQVQAYC